MPEMAYAPQFICKVQYCPMWLCTYCIFQQCSSFKLHCLVQFRKQGLILIVLFKLVPFPQMNWFNKHFVRTYVPRGTELQLFHNVSATA